MKYIIIAVMTLNFSYSQVSVYLPLKTIHLNNELRDDFIEGEGGDKGIVIGFDNNNVTYSVGYIINSFGDASLLGCVGYSFNLGSVKSTLSLGFSNGYEHIYENNINALELGSFFERNGIMPVALCSVKFPVYKNIGIQLNLSPVYLNYGVYFNIDSGNNRWINNRK